MAKRKWCVRVVQTHTPDGQELHEGGDLGSFVECLRYAGIVTVHRTDPAGLTSVCFDLHCPPGLDSQAWAEMNAKRMQTFGFNAAAAPSAEQ